MSWQAVAWAKSRRTEASARKAVLLLVAEHCDQWGWTWVGCGLIAEEAELSERSVRRALRQLAEGGFLEIYQGRGARGQSQNLYRVRFGDDPACSKAAGKDPMPAAHPSRSGRFHLLTDAPADTLTDGPADTLTDGPADTLSGGPADTLSGGPADTDDRAGGHSRPSRRTQCPPNLPITGKEPSGAAAGAAAGGQPTPEPTRTAVPPGCARPPGRGVPTLPDRGAPTRRPILSGRRTRGRGNAGLLGKGRSRRRSGPRPERPRARR